MATNVLFVPSFQNHTTPENSYSHLYNELAQRGYNTVPVFANARGLPADWVTQLYQVYDRFDPSQTILAGHWDGAFTAFLIATLRNPFALWLFSLPPFFQEDTPSLSGHLKNAIGPQLLEIFQNIPFSNNASLIKCRTLVFVVAEANQNAAHRAREAEALMQDAERIVLPVAGYNNLAKTHSTYVRHASEYF
jgi:hypothetical protein